MDYCNSLILGDTNVEPPSVIYILFAIDFLFLNEKIFNCKF